jgi:hypothetical protein
MGTTLEIQRVGLLCPTKYHTTMGAVTPKFLGVAYRDPIATLLFSEEPTPEEVTAIQAADASFVDVDPVLYVRNNVVRPRRDFGRAVMDDFLIECLILGAEAAGRTNTIRQATHEASGALGLGALQDGITEIRAIPAELKDPVFLSTARLLAVVNKIETYLGLPLSEEL